MLGFGGHFLTKAHRYSITFGLLRATRAIYRRAAPADPYPADPIERDDTETLLVLADLTYTGTGWRTAGDALLANTAAALARDRQHVGRDELAHQATATLAAPATA